MTTDETGNATTTTTTPSESEIYDRQIRLWGAEAQKKMQSSKVLYVHVTGSSSEVLKNLCLAGIKAEICDPRPADRLDSSPCFFTHPNDDDAEGSPPPKKKKKKIRYDSVAHAVRPNDDDDDDDDDDAEGSPPPKKKKKKIRYDSVAHAVRPLVEALNPLLGSCPIVEKEVGALTEEDLKGYAVVVASMVPVDEAVRLSRILAEGSVLYTIDCFGMRGTATIDFGRGDPPRLYRPEQGKKLLDPTPLKDVVPLSEMVRVPLHKATNRFHKKGPPPTWVMFRGLMEHRKLTGGWLGEDGTDADRARETISAFLEREKATLTDDELDDLVTAGVAQVPPVCAVLGGMVGNEVIKIISGKGEPANNTLLFDGGSCKAWTFLVKAKEP
eukprot:CAMPEP_0197196856 /NCGR_PEP_ID=MMETSP1423-20130617/32568_1 /TAXON_ID=476441 /ORGANISM="Pseudo-nitzschia heimii, Strain UNC1101" /LENGTH=383 /DNA_ID=CAMNT_0042650669 /DNA_START=52 /DNA_END=1203 /DNA_ORIENTATION=+